MTWRAVLLIVGVATPAAAQPAPWRPYFGNLHSHSSVSDGVDRPRAAFAHAKDAGVDFLCLSEHHHDAPPSHTTQAGLTEADGAAVGATSATFVGLVGQEFSTISNGNHVNVFDVATQIPKDLLNDYARLFGDWLPQYQKKNPKRIVVAQFNHPDDCAKDYGRIGYRVRAADGGTQLKANFDGNLDAFRKGVDPWVRTIAIISGPADTTQKNAVGLPVGQHRDFDSSYVSSWHDYLELGLHLSPSADQDNHSRTWGNRTAARTGVWLPGVFNREELLNALKQNRTFATEDPNLAVWFAVAGRPLGSRIARPLHGRLDVEAVARDPNEPSATYAYQLFVETIGDGKRPELFAKSGLLKDGERWSIVYEAELEAPIALLVKVSQFSGNASPDEAWTSPVWVESAPVGLSPGAPEEDEVAADGGVRFVGSKSTDVFHFPECKIAKQIVKAGNAVEFTGAPEKRHLHQGCPR